MQQLKLMLKNKIAIVTGGASGLGLVIANTLSEAGATIIIFDRDPDLLQKAPDTFQKNLVDVTEQDNVQAAVDNVIALHGQVDILVNNAGIIHNEPLINITKSQRKHDYAAYKKIIDINMNSVFLLSSIIAEHMIMKRTPGVIINISSISAAGNAGQTAYSAAKAGVNAFTKTWAKELGSFGIRVVAVAPGFIETQSTKDALNTTIINSIVKKIPLKKLGAAIDIANTVLMVAHNPYINGTIIDVHGGLSL